MATLQKIRNRAGFLVAIVIGLALLAFILGDLFSSGSSLFSDSQNEIAEVAGKSIPVHVYSQMVEETIDNYKRTQGQNNLDEQQMDMIRQQTWDQIIREYVMSEEYEEIGIGLSPEELFDMVQGNNIHPQILQIPIFQNQTTGIFDRNLVIQFLKNMDNDETGNARTSWISFEKSLSEDRINTKYNNLITKGLYVTDLQAGKEVVDRYNTVDIEYVQIPFSYINDSSIEVSQEDLATYYDKNKENYEQQASRDIEYITFDVVPSEEDNQLADRWINEIKAEFENTENDEQFINLNSDIAFDPTYYAEGEIENAVLNEFAFNSESDSVYGPYFENGSYKLAKLSKTENLSDSVKASHILIKPEDHNNSIVRAQEIIDSLKNLVESGSKFEDLANVFGTDGTAEKGGDLGWFKFGAMVPPFSDSSFFAEVGDIKTVTTRFGVHLIKVTDQSKKVEKVQVGILERIVEPSSKTYQFIYQQASQFAGLNNTSEKFDKGREEKGITKKLANNLGENDKRIAGLDSPRELVRWTFKAEEGNVSNVFEFGSKFVVATLIDAREKGFTKLEDIESEIRVNVKKEKQGELIAVQLSKTLSEGKSVQDIAGEMKGATKTANKVNFSSYSVPGLGVEPKVSGTASFLAINELSEPIIGNLGVYVIKVININESGDKDAESEKTHLKRSITSRINYLTFDALKDNANIVDNRSKFY